MLTGAAHMLSKEAWYALLIGLVLGQILSIPFGLATGLLFPKVQQWVDARGKARVLAKSKRMRADYEEALYFVTNPHRMTHYFLNRGVELLRWCVLLFLAVGGLAYAPFKVDRGIWGTTSALIWAGGILFFIIAFSQQVNELHEIYYRVEFWGEYRQKVLQALPDLAACGKTRLEAMA